MQEFENQQVDKERVVLIAVHKDDTDQATFEASLTELEQLVETAGGTVTAVLTQNRRSLDSKTYVGKGKLEEAVETAEEYEADLLIFNDELSPGQISTITNQTGLYIIDRTQLILDIFAGRAASNEGKMQVELAQLNYMLPRIRGQGESLSRLGGGIGTRGPGETKLETDRRHIQKRMDDVRSKLKKVKNRREQYRERRKEKNVLQFALVGYTNAGKSTILNALTEADTLEENALFATLDPLTRRVELPSGLEVLVTDTVGFIQDLPTALIAAFQATLEEVKEADVLLHVIDGSHPRAAEQAATVRRLLKELEASHIPALTVVNKRDAVEDGPVVAADKPSISISARKDEDVELLRESMENVLLEQLQPYHVEIPLADGHVMQRFKHETVVREETLDEANESWILSGYVQSDQAIHREIKQYAKGDPGAK